MEFRYYNGAAENFPFLNDFSIIVIILEREGLEQAVKFSPKLRT